MDWSLIKLTNNGTDKSWKISYKQFMIYTLRVRVDGNWKLVSLNGLFLDKFNKKVPMYFKFYINNSVFILKEAGPISLYINDVNVETNPQIKGRNDEQRGANYVQKHDQLDQQIKAYNQKVDEIEAALKKGSLNSYKNFQFDVYMSQVDHMAKATEIVLQRIEDESKVAILCLMLDRLTKQRDILQDLHTHRDLNNQTQRQRVNDDDENQIIIMQDDDPADDGQPQKHDTNQQQDEDNLCIICMDQPKTHAALPCGHMCYCEDCSNLVVQKKKCYNCEQPATNVIKIFK